MKPQVGILAYGSLIGDARWEITEVRTRTIEDVETPFAVEFARSSRGRGGAPTLVPYDQGGAVRARVLVVDTSVEDATDRLYRRECDIVGSRTRYVYGDNPGLNTVVIEQLKGEFGLDVVLYTRIGANIERPTVAKLARLAIDSVAQAKPGRDGISYLMNAMNAGIATPLTAAYAAEVLRLTGAGDLAAALLAVRAKVKA